jgi:hypothetical protein
LDKRDDESKKRKEQLADHRNKIIKEYSTYLNNNLRTTESSLEGYLSQFRYNKEFLQHLHTGHTELYNLLNTVIESEKQSDKVFSVALEKIKERIRKETEEIIKPDNENAREEDKPSFDEDEIANHILTEIDDINTWKGFTSSKDETASRIIVSNNKWFHLHLFDQKRSDNFVTTLNDIVRDPGISADIVHYHNIRQIKDDKCSDFERKINDFIRGIELRARSLGGACDKCINLHDKKDISLFQPLLSQPH